MVWATSPKESTHSGGFFEITGAAVTRWVSGSSYKTDPNENVAPVFMVLLLKRSSCCRKCLACFAHLVGKPCTPWVERPTCRLSDDIETKNSKTGVVH